MTPPRPGTAQSRTVDLLQAIDLYASGRDFADDHTDDSRTADLQALRWLVEILTRIVQAHPGIAEVAETYAARAAEDLDLIERES